MTSEVIEKFVESAAVAGKPVTVSFKQRNNVTGIFIQGYDYADMKKKLLFVCIENSNRSQMSQAFATILGGATVQAYSAGSKPSGIVNPKAIAAMRELGYDLSKHDSKSLKEVEQYAPFDAVVTMGCGDACPWMPAKKFIDWQIPDPRNMNEAEFREVRDLLKEKVAALLQEL